MATKAVTRGPGAGFGHPFLGTGNEVIAINICIEESGICKMLNFLLDTMCPVLQEGSWDSAGRRRPAGGAASNATANWAFLPPAIYNVLH